MQDPKVKIDLKQKQQEDVDRLRTAFEEVAETESGRVVLKFLMQKCYFLQSTMTVDPHTTKIITENMAAYEMLRRLYLLSIRPFIPKGIRQKLEN
jgi:hypothetical protein